MALDPMVIATKGMWTWNEDPLARATQGWAQGLLAYIGAEIINLTSGILRILNLRSDV